MKTNPNSSNRNAAPSNRASTDPESDQNAAGTETGNPGGSTFPGARNSPVNTLSGGATAETLERERRGANIVERGDGVSGTSSIQNGQQLQAAIDSARPGETVTLDSDLWTNRTITLRDGVNLNGNGKTIGYTNPGKSYTSPNGDYAPALRIEGSNSTVTGLTINGGNRYGKHALITLDNTGDHRTDNVIIDNVKLSNAQAGIRNRGVLPEKLVIRNSEFVNTNKGIDLTRDSFASNNVQTSPAGRKAPDGQYLEYQYSDTLNINNNSFHTTDGRPMQVGIQIDAGNDGRNPRRPPGFEAGSDYQRSAFDNDISYFSQANIFGNHGRTPSEPIKATEFGIAIAKVENVNITDNRVQTVGYSNSSDDFSSGINVENLSNNVSVRNNIVNVSRGVNGRQNNQGISVLAFQDHGNRLSISKASTNVRIEGNDISGAGSNGIFGAGVRDLYIGRNSFNNFEPRRGDGGRARHVSVFNVDSNQNGRLDYGEASTIVPTNGLTGLDTNIRPGDNVSELLSDVGDSSALPPDRRNGGY